MSAEGVLITGGAGFIGTNLADALARDGRAVVVLDDLSRPGSQANAAWLQERHGDRVRLIPADVRTARFEPVLVEVDAVYHLAAQVAVTSSLQDPLADFDVNARGTLRLLEALRVLPAPPRLVYTSTNKVYGSLADLDLELTERGWRPAAPAAPPGVDESRPLDLHSPYGCSKGAADQYVRDFTRSFGIPAVVLRMSCIYGPHQNGSEDQGWVAHFARSILEGRPVTVYGDGHQVRDVLYVADLIDALRAAAAAPPGEIYNVGGGPGNAVSLLQVLRELEGIAGREATVRSSDWRVGDQRWYVSDPGRFQAATGWCPRTAWQAGLHTLVEWLGSQAGRPAQRGDSRVA